MNKRLAFVRVIGGELFDYLKDIDIFGRITEEEDFIVFGCRNEDQGRFYKGILEYDKSTEIVGFETVEEVKDWWEDGSDMLMHIEKGAFDVVELIKTT